VPTIGIGAGAKCDGQVLVSYDLLGLTQGSMPRFVRQYANVQNVIREAAERYVNEVQGGKFPGREHEFR
jgi:3-methyl-2-oxobutanoate hydroxymethyltransferase